jgi:hypothetical protein
VPILLQKSPSNGSKEKTRNNRIRMSARLNQYCDLAADFESTFLARDPKIILQQYLPSADKTLVVWAAGTHD